MLGAYPSSRNFQKSFVIRRSAVITILLSKPFFFVPSKRKISLFGWLNSGNQNKPHIPFI
jgi:hypothetical protein